MKSSFSVVFKSASVPDATLLLLFFIPFNNKFEISFYS